MVAATLTGPLLVSVWITSRQKEPEDWTKGCFQKKPLNCHNGDSFLKYTALILTDNQYSWFNQTMSTKESKMVCLKNCSWNYAVPQLGYDKKQQEIVKVSLLLLLCIYEARILLKGQRIQLGANRVQVRVRP
ncbi:hypothetical protein LguiA_003839 [Lonicera macranthoides]